MQNSNLVIQHTNFEFDKAATTFISSRIDQLFGEKARVMVKAVRAYMKETAYGQIHSSNYELVCQIKGYTITRLTENSVVSVNGEEVVGVMNSKVNMALFQPTDYVEMSAEDALTSVDAAFKFHNEQIAPDGSHKSTLFSLRPLIREALSKCDKAYVNADDQHHSWIILLEDTPGYSYGLVVNLNNSVVKVEQA